MTDHDGNQGPPTEPMDAAERAQVVASIGRLLQDKYIFPKAAQEMVEQMERNLNKDEYVSITDTKEFAQRLTNDLQSISHDKHLTVEFDPKNVEIMRNMEQQGENKEHQIQQEHLKELQFGNFGFKEIKILLGNIGYMDLRSFCKASVAGETAVAAMNIVANCSALIFDLRHNGGGSPTMIQLLTSYLYDAGHKPLHLNSFYWRPKDATEQFWTLPHVPGKRLGSQTDIYVLTSRRTFSAAEEFTYNLKQLKRATIVGETTGGGAHPGGTEVVNDRFLVWIPTGRAINPITKTNWEGTGVEPDIQVDQEQALDTAHVTALERLMAKNTDPFYQSLYERHFEILQKKLQDNEGTRVGRE